MVLRKVVLELHNDDKIGWLALVKPEGKGVMYDPATKFMFYAVCRRTHEEILCASKREAEGVVAINNDSRGQGFEDLRLP